MAEADLDGTRLLLVDRTEDDLHAGVEVRCRWEDNPRQLPRALLNRLRLDKSSVKWTPDDP